MIQKGKNNKINYILIMLIMNYLKYIIFNSISIANMDVIFDFDTARSLSLKQKIKPIDDNMVKNDYIYL